MANEQLLDQLNKKTWNHAKKTASIWAREVVEDCQIQTIEGLETVKAGQFLCKGDAGDVWPQKKEKLEKTYNKTSITQIWNQDTVWTRYTPNPDSVGVVALEVGEPFQLQTKWGTFNGKAGDYIVKNYDDKDNPYPKDIWIVDRKRFDATYEFVHRKFIYNDNSKGQRHAIQVFECMARNITEADLWFEKTLGYHPSTRKHIGCHADKPN